MHLEDIPGKSSMPDIEIFRRHQYIFFCLKTLFLILSVSLLFFFFKQSMYFTLLPLVDFYILHFYTLLASLDFTHRGVCVSVCFFSIILFGFIEYCLVCVLYQCCKVVSIRTLYPYILLFLLSHFFFISNNMDIMFLIYPIYFYIFPAHTNLLFSSYINLNILYLLFSHSVVPSSSVTVNS